MAAKRALITGITGQDGSYLADLLVEKGYEVHGIVRRVAIEDPDRRLRRLQHVLPKLTLHSGSLDSFPGLYAAVEAARPDECYHLAAQSYVTYSFDDEASTLNTNINGTHYLLSCIRKLAPQCRFYFAGSSEMFGSASESPQNEQTRFRPRSTYGISKVAAYELARNYRDGYGMFASTGILFNHESPRRGFEFVSRKITSHVARIKAGKLKSLKLGNLDAQRDWGHAREYVRAMWLMLQKDKPDDYVVATGQCHTVRQFVEASFAAAGLNWQDHVEIDKALFRPAEVHPLRGDASKARRELGWECRVSFEQLVEEMVRADIDALAS